MICDIKKLEPYKSIILIEEFQWPEKTKSGIWMPNVVRYSETKGGRLPWRGKVIRAGNKVKQLEAGEIVRYQPDNYVGRTVIGQTGKRYLLIEELLIYAVEDEDENIIRALKNRIVFAPEALEEKYGQLYLPQKREEPILYGKILVSGPGAGVKPGERVAIKNASTWQYFDSAGKRYILTDKFNLLGTITKEK